MGVLDELRSARSYYEASVIRPAARPPLAGRQATGVAIVGGGFAGVSAALELAERGFEVTLLEAGRIGDVASGRNGGQVLAGLACEPDTLEAQLGLDASRRIWDLSVEAVRRVRTLLAKHAIDADVRDASLNVACTAKSALAMRNAFDMMASRYGCTALQWLDRDAVARHIASDRYHGGWRDPDSFHLHPLKYLLGLAAAAERAGVRVHENSRVLRIEAGSRPLAHTGSGVLSCDHLVLAGGAPLGETIAPFGRLTMPYDSWILATVPLDPALAHSLIPGGEAVADDSYDIDYYRITPDHRLLFGSGVNYLARDAAAARAFLTRRMCAVFPQLAGIGTAEVWGGIMEIPMNRAPVIGALSNRVLHIQGFGGHGVAFSGMAGRILAEHLAGETEHFALLSRIRHRPFPFGRWLQVPTMVVGTYAYRLLERIQTG